MIYNNIKNIEKYKYDVKLYDALSELSKIKIGSTNEEYLVNTGLLSEAKFERYIKNTDIHFVIDGYEIILITNEIRDLKVITPYNPENDIEFYKLNNSYSVLRLNAGDFLVVDPSEAHAPIITDDARIISKLCKKITI